MRIQIEAEPDQFDSDFNDTEDEGDENEDNEKTAAKGGAEQDVSICVNMYVYMYLDIYNIIICNI
jgi:hypothetical protein